MADSKITALASISTSTDPAVDPLVIVDVSDTSMAATGTTKKVTLNNLLSSSPTATGNFTITGDLTVDTSTLKVDSTNNTVGIGNATPPTGASNTDIGLTLGAAGTVRSVLLGMQNCFGRIRERDATNNLAITTNIGATGTIDDNTRSSWKIRIGSGNDNYVLQRAAIGSSTFNDLLAIDSAGVCVWSDGAGGTRMTLNSTGLGIGATPVERLTIGSTTAANYIKLTNSGATTGFLIGSFNTSVDIKNREAGAMNFFTSDTQRMTIDASGNTVLGTAAVATTATDGFLYVTGCAGTPTGTPTAKTGRVPIVVDTTNSKLYFYSGGSWVAAN